MVRITRLAVGPFIAILIGLLMNEQSTTVGNKDYIHLTYTHLFDIFAYMSMMSVLEGNIIL